MTSSACCGNEDRPSKPAVQIPPAPTTEDNGTDIACCGQPSYPASSPYEKPGYQLWHFVEDFEKTPVGPVPRIKVKPSWRDYLGTVLARIGFKRDQYKVAPGLYTVGHPLAEDPVLVTANYKLSFDAVRKSMAGENAWILVLETRGINVWCAAGKGTFGTDELVTRIDATQLSEVVSHRRLILPQLGATGVVARKVKKASGFKVIWGPVQASSLKSFFENGCKADLGMRQVTFSLFERAVLVPVELYHLPKPTLWILLAVFLLSGIGTTIFSFTTSWSRGWVAMAAYFSGVISGAVAAPILLPWIPGRSFALKGAIVGTAAGILLSLGLIGSWVGLEVVALVLFSAAISSYLAMNFTGATPFTSPTGVEKEMRMAIPLQAAAVFLAAVAWVATPFT